MEPAPVDLRDLTLPKQEVADEMMRRMARAERWLTKAPDYGGLFVCQMMDQADVWLNEVEEAGRLHGLLPNVVVERLAKLRQIRDQLKYDLDL